jgi:Ca2+-binding EF-hand superfamily protein
VSITRSGKENFTASQTLGLLAGMVFAMSSVASVGTGRHEANKTSAPLQQEFKKFDKNGDGYLSPEEVQAANEAAFKVADLNADNRLSLEEFTKFMTERAGGKGGTRKPAGRMSPHPSSQPMQQPAPH